MKLTDNEIQISLTQFSSFATKPAPQQLTVVRTIRKQHEEGYDVPPDLYKQFRDGVRDMHQNGMPKTYLDEIANRQTEAARQKHYPILANGYKKFLGRKEAEWLEPPSGVWKFEDLKINIRPEVGLLYDGDPLLIKLWLKDDKTIDKRRAGVIAHLMRLSIDSCQEDLTPCVLDVRRGKLFRIDKSDREQTALLHAQAKAFTSLYREL